MKDIGRLRKYEVYLAERQKRDLAGGLWGLGGGLGGVAT